jgi:hypothetical protein
MKRRMLLFRLSVVVGLACLPLAANAQQAAKLHRLGWLGNNTPTFPPTRVSGKACVNWVMPRERTSRLSGGQP